MKNELQNKKTFIDKWDEVKSILEIIKSATKNPVVKLSISIIISVGDTLYKNWTEKV